MWGRYGLVVRSGKWREHSGKVPEFAIRFGVPSYGAWVEEELKKEQSRQTFEERRKLLGIEEVLPSGYPTSDAFVEEIRHTSAHSKHGKVGRYFDLLVSADIVQKR